MDFKLASDYQPQGDQPKAIEQLVAGVEAGEPYQVLLGVTGSGKTYTMANVIEKINKPTLIMSHNKTLVAQLYGEFQQFFPENAVEYFVSYYDYYQPEAYIAATDLYIEKDLSINEQIERMRMRSTTSLLSGRKDVLVVASVSCIYGMGNPASFQQMTVRLRVGQVITRNKLLHKLVESLFTRTTAALMPGTFRVSGDTVDVLPPYTDVGFRITLWGDEIEGLETVDPKTGKALEERPELNIYPANLFVTTPDVQKMAIHGIQDDMVAQVQFFEEEKKYLEAKRLDERVTFDLEMIRELGYCSGIENYSRYFDRRNPGDRPFCLLDYFPEDFLLFIDESHVTIPQIRAMYTGDRARKSSLVDYGFRLPAALDNRPLKFEEFESIIPQTIYVSATPSNYEMEQTEGLFVEQVVRPTGLLDPEIGVRPCQNQVDDLLDEIEERVKTGDRVLVTTLTKRMAEELTKYLRNLNIRCQYIHSEIDTLERVEILRNLRLGKIDVLVGINLLREGLDLPEVSLVAILDADKEGFLRSETSLTQTAGRAARNVNGRVIMYADVVTKSMQRTIDETNRRREKQIRYNEEHGITPQTIRKTVEQIMRQTSVADNKATSEANKREEKRMSMVADPVVNYMSKDQLTKSIENTRKKMMKAAQDMDFIEAARLRDEMYALEELKKEKFE